MRTKDLDLGRLCCAIKQDRLILMRAREERREAVREYIGKHWSEEGTAHTVPLNLLSLFCRVVGPKLISNNPRVMLSTIRKQHRPVVTAMETWANDQIAKINLKGTLQRNSMDGLFSVGICKVAIASPADSSVKAWNMKAGQPFVMNIDLDDFVFDTHARSFDEWGYVGHRFRVPLAVVKEAKIYGAQRKDLVGADDRMYNLEGDERISMLGREYYSQEEELEPMIDLWEIYLPRHRCIVTLADDNITGATQVGKYTAKALREVGWIGPDRGPILTLAYGIVPGNAMPKGPIQDLIDLHCPINNIFRKQINQAHRQKSNLLYSGSSIEDAEAVRNANDGDAVQVNDPKNVQEVSRGGPHPANYTLGIQLKELFSWAAGGLDIMGGLSPQAKTAAQDKMLNQNAHAGIADLQQKTIEYTADVLRSLLWFWHHHPTQEIETEFDVPGFAFEATRKIQPAQRHAIPFEQLAIQVDPYTLLHQTPQEKLQMIDGTVAALMPMMQLLQQQGVMFDARKWMEMKAKFANLPELAELFTIGEPPVEGPKGGSKGATMPAETERSYVRRSLGGDSQQAKQEEMSMSMESMAGPEMNGKA